MKSHNINWDAAAAIIAAFIGLLALLVAGYTAYIQHQGVQTEIKGVRAQVWPYVEIGESSIVSSDAKEVTGGRLIAVNTGVGPAIIRSVEVFVNGKAKPDWMHVFKAIDFQTPYSSFSSFNKTVLSAGKTLAYLKIYGQKAWSKFRAKLYSDIVIRACYCSTLGQCWQSTLNFNAPIRQGQPVSSCPTAQNSLQFTDVTSHDQALTSKSSTASSPTPASP